MSEYQVNNVQIVFDDEDFRIENLTNEILNLTRMVESIERKYYKNENLRFMCIFNTLQNLLDEKHRELDAVSSV